MHSLSDRKAKNDWCSFSPFAGHGAWAVITVPSHVLKGKGGNHV